MDLFDATRWLLSATAVLVTRSNSVRQLARRHGYNLRDLRKEDLITFSQAGLLGVSLKTREQIEQGVVRNPDDTEVLRFRDAISTQCNMDGVAGSIFASVTITGLTLDHIDEVHWTVQAFWITSLVFGSLSVYYACEMQRAMRMLWRASDFRGWLTIGGKQDLVTGRVSGYGLAMMRASSGALAYSIVFFLVGLGLYLGFVWKWDVAPPNIGMEGSRAVFIFFLTFTVLGFLNFDWPATYKYIEDGLVGEYNEEKGMDERDGEANVNVHGEKHDAKLWDAPSRDGYTARVGEATSHGFPETGNMGDPAQRRDLDISDNGLSSLILALEKAARLHEEAAEADKQVADALRALQSRK